MIMCKEWLSRGYTDTILRRLDNLNFPGTLNQPTWMGDKSFHESHQSNLLRKDQRYYIQFGWNVPNDLPYVWPEV